MNDRELIERIDALLDGAISEADFLRLEAELHVSTEARQTYYERLKLHNALQIESERLAEAAPASESKVIRFPSWRLGGGAIAAAAAVVLFAGSAGWFIGQVGSGAGSDAPVAGEPVASGFGVVTEVADAVWQDGRALGRGELLPSGSLQLVSGTVQLELFSGVRVIVEGEAEFEVLSPMEMAVSRGRLQAQVPELAEGFRVHTAAGEVVDLGTEFALDVTPDHAEVHVLDGEIEWHPVDRDMHHLSKGEALRSPASEGGGETEALEHDAGRFTGFDEIGQRLARGREQRRESWLAHSRELASDPRVVLYFPMADAGVDPRKIENAGAAEINGSVVRADRVSDRWGVAGAALDFTPAGSRVRVNVPGEHASMTFYCWVRIDSLDRWYNSLFLTDGHEIGEPHWQILDDGRLFFSVKKNDPKVDGKTQDKHIFYSPRIWTPAQSGQWFQIATTYDVEARQVTHYVNGEIVSREPIAEEWLVEAVRIDAASIGNWSEPVYRRDDPSFMVRNLNGVIDEFALFSAALSAEEIRELYEIGKP